MKPEDEQGIRIAIINGPNHRRLGRRRPAVYGATTAEHIILELDAQAIDLDVRLLHYQSNHEGAILDWLEVHAYEISGIVCNPAGLTNYGLALRDCLDELGAPVAIVHVSNIYAREEWRRNDRFAEIADAYIVGCGWRSYRYALDEIVGQARAIVDRRADGLAASTPL